MAVGVTVADTPGILSVDALCIDGIDIRHRYFFFSLKYFNNKTFQKNSAEEPVKLAITLYFKTVNYVELSEDYLITKIHDNVRKKKRIIDLRTN